ncbi:MAG: type II toxin-antitoxin system VapC family toxin [Hydrogenophaga sp.]|nr:type II toxin-antitoxin system VapC family toxin [Polaromonas sp.]MDP3164597.1 type II toxin-antitoxin system VapC family toxin [Hydrogenophaga sp.]
MLYMLDTNICIYLLKGLPQKVLDRLAKEDVGSVVMSSLTLAELRHGLEMQRAPVRKKDEAAFEALLQDIPALDFDQDAAKAFGILAATGKLRRSQAIDNLIAAHAISRQAVLVTNNEKDFKDYPGLVVENWA